MTLNPANPNFNPTTTFQDYESWRAKQEYNYHYEMSPNGNAVFSVIQWAYQGQDIRAITISENWEQAQDILTAWKLAGLVQ